MYNFYICSTRMNPQNCWKWQRRDEISKGKTTWWKKRKIVNFSPNFFPKRSLSPWVFHNSCSFANCTIAVDWNCTNRERLCSWFGVVVLIIYSYGRYISVHVTQFLFAFFLRVSKVSTQKKSYSIQLVFIRSFIFTYINVELLPGLVLNRIIHVT